MLNIAKCQINDLIMMSVRCGCFRITANKLIHETFKMDYKKEYQQTIEQLFFAVRELEESKRSEELNYLILTKQSEVISLLYENIDKMDGQRKDNAKNTMEKLIFVFMHIGKIYLDELKWRKDLFKANQSLIEAAKRIEDLEKELRTEREMNML